MGSILVVPDAVMVTDGKMMVPFMSGREVKILMCDYIKTMIVYHRRLCPVCGIFVDYLMRAHDPESFFCI